MVDVYNIIYRAFHACEPKYTSKGFPVAAVHMALHMIGKIRAPDIQFALAVFDGEENFRETIDPAYKAQRDPMPEELKIQVPAILKGLQTMGWPAYVAEGVEADDVIATYAARAAAAGHDVRIYSCDKDMRALAGPRIRIVDTMNKVTYDEQTVFEKMGVRPAQVRLFLSLMGDSADNIQGIDKCGAKTAAAWCNRYLDFEGLCAAAGDLSGKAGENFRAALASGRFAVDYELAGLRLDVPLNLTRKQLSFQTPDPEALRAFAAEYEIASWLDPRQNYAPRARA